VQNRHSNENNKRQHGCNSRIALGQPIMHMDSDQSILASMTDDLKEGIEALIEHRKPRFRGK
jgi:1,4-dihydroxy-2-naphthoyl-CoA synthase